MPGLVLTDRVATIELEWLQRRLQQRPRQREATEEGSGSNRRTGEGDAAKVAEEARGVAAAQRAVTNAEAALCGTYGAVAPPHCEGVWLLGLQSRRFFCACVFTIEASVGRALSLIFPSLLRPPVKVSTSPVTFGAL